MTTTQAIESLLKNGVSEIRIGKPDERPGMVFAACVHGLPMGAQGNQVVCNHQAVEPETKIEECLNNLAAQVEKAVTLKVEPTIVAPNKRN